MLGVFESVTEYARKGWRALRVWGSTLSTTVRLDEATKPTENPGKHPLHSIITSIHEIPH